MKVYISGALAAAKNLSASVDFYEKLAKELEKSGLESHLPHRANHPSVHGGRSDVSVYHDDVKALLSCDVCLARLDEPSLGVGAEIALALERRLPVVAYHRRDVKVSRFVTGLIRGAGEPNAVLDYSSWEELCTKVRDRIAAMAPVSHSG